ncbi:hypothetical protein IW262DRAFT_968661 [Armillaria fumosa]|nr:hypothetical protein IW262DRAFT_968661 [Armillaria fumosa]
MYHLAVKNAYSDTTCFCNRAPPADWQNKIAKLEDRIKKLENITSSDGDLSKDIVIAQTAANNAKETADIAQSIAKNVLIAKRNRHNYVLGGKFSMLKKVKLGSGLKLAKEVCPVNKNDLEDLSSAPLVGSTPDWELKDNFEMYSNEDILKMIIFYNDNVGIAFKDALSERIHKFRFFFVDMRRHVEVVFFVLLYHFRLIVSNRTV